MKKKTILPQSIIFAALAVLLVSSVTPSSGVDLDTYYSVEFISAVTYTDGTYGTVQNWTYRVTAKASAPHGVSHIVFGELGIPCNPAADKVIGYDWDQPITSPNQYIWGDQVSAVEIGKDPYTGVDPGIKFEFDPALGDEGEESVYVYFTLLGEWPLGTIQAWIKADLMDPQTHDPESDPLTGPDCTIIPELPLGPTIALVSTTASMIAFKRRRQAANKA